ncbi:putative ribonuclease H-like domain-containing protein, partial [Tanacetum coccineum]
MTALSTSSTNDVNTTNPAYAVSTVNSNINTACPQVSTANFSDNTVYDFMVENPNGSNLLQQDLEQIHEDDLEAMDLKWQLSLLSMRAKRNQDNTRKQGNNEDTSSKAMLAIDGVGFDWSDMAEEQVQTNIALMAFSDSEEVLAYVEEQLITYRKNKVLFSEEVAVLKREVDCKDYEINVLKSEFEKVKQEKEDIEFKIKKFDNTSKSLNKLLESQITDKSKKGLGYNVVPPPHPLIYNRPKKGKPQQDDTGFIDSGCSRHMTGNIAYLSDFKEFDGGYVTFGGGAHGGRIFESLTYLVAKATSDESMLWHRRLGHINFKNINKLVKDNL